MKILLVSIGILIFFTSFSINSFNYSKKVVDRKIDYFNFSLIKTGDIVFRKENNFLSDIFSNIDSKYYSHIGIVIKKGNQIQIYHMESDGKSKDLKIDQLEDFVKFSTKIGFYRYNKDIDQSEILQILNTLENSNIKFDFDFDLNNDKLYCTEFINELYFKLFKENLYTYLYDFYGKKGITINSILKNNKLIKIKEINF